MHRKRGKKAKNSTMRWLHALKQQQLYLYVLPMTLVWNLQNWKNYLIYRQINHIW